MTAVATHFDVVVRGGKLAHAFQEAERSVCSSDKDRLRLWTEFQRAPARAGGSVFIVSRLVDLSQARELAFVEQLQGAAKHFLLFLDQEQMPAESIAERVAELGVRSKDCLHLARLVVDDEVSFARRFVAGLLDTNREGSIMDAWWDADEFVVISPTFQRLRIPVDKLPKIRNASPDERAKFEIDPEGDFVYWPSHDVHMGWSQFQQIIDPESRLRAQQKSQAFNERYGRAIRALRESMKLNQQSIDGLDERTIRRIEQGKTRATSNAIAKLAKAHRLSPSQYMTKVSGMMEK